MLKPYRLRPFKIQCSEEITRPLSDYDFVRVFTLILVFRNTKDNILILFNLSQLARCLQNTQKEMLIHSIKVI